ncbi:NAD-dependent succinate-semialdehyde dehydrogenase [Polymorphobacter megasporae]|uniref:NAD-dependent succinate-semialdehyde dehydrogenase n=1 Tax=Glacieibacterium megasporae TaxID=2835787 RepID=UPI001C1E8CE4|nr:NAD-dependent succinate-semialdehyde dehydrogenase [Polymorphobacter megasporae]UAJ12583.1 NAD-dependent succinate-semialdehyde dehydrogenase [Polymorphobacter megasporae]
MNDDHDYPKPTLFIAGVWRAAGDGATIPVVDPATGATIADLPVATQGDLDEALAAADAGFKIWRAVSAYDRARVLRRAADLLRERASQIGAISTREQGKPISESTAEAFACADIFDWYAEEARRAYGRIVPSKHPGVRHLVTKEPIGPVAAFSPWNFPTTIPSRKLAAALAAGCSVIIKPAEETPGSALALARALDDAGLPKGVLNVVFGVPPDISSYLIASPVIRKITFTGSTAVGKQLGVLAARVMKPTTMELGGHAPVIVFADADLDRAVPMLAAGKYRNAGQICIAPTRFYLHESIHDAFVEKFAAAAARLRLGNGLDPATTMGPLANPRRLSAMHDMVAEAAATGARVVTGGDATGGAGNFWQPTVLADVPNAARIMNEEPFGPVAVTQRFDRFDDVVAQANRLPYGLAAYAWTRSARTAADIGDVIEAGMVGINFVGLTGPETPFGGVKESGHGSEGGSEGLDAYLHHKYIAQG